MKRAHILTYHSQIISGQTYATNDHVALAEDLALCGSLGFACVRATALVRALRTGRFDALPDKCVVITMDDGAVFDFEPTEAPPHGVQPPMAALLRAAGGAPRRGAWGAWRWPWSAPPPRSAPPRSC